MSKKAREKVTVDIPGLLLVLALISDSEADIIPYYLIDKV